MLTQISVVIPTYNRTIQLSDVIDKILLSEAKSFSLIEIIVVDDGSVISPETMISNKMVIKPFTLTYVRQNNAGPAKARNTGFRRAKSEIVLFIDDDILVPPRLLIQHVQAHLDYPESVIIGPCPCVQPDRAIPSSRYIRMLENDYLRTIPDDGFTEVTTVVSGNLSIEREMFLEQNGLYDDNLNSPTAEEFDIIAKLRLRKIPVYLGKGMVAMHLQSTSIEETCKREYKHAIGIGEIAAKAPELAIQLEEVKTFLSVNGEISKNDTTSVIVKKGIKGFLSRERTRNAILYLVRLTERLLPIDRLLFPMFRAVIGLNILAGVRDGIKKFEN